MGRAADERATLEKAVGQVKDAKQRTSWRIRLTLMDNDMSKGKNREEFQKLSEGAIAALEKLAKPGESERDAAGACAVEPQRVRWLRVPAGRRAGARPRGPGRAG